MQVVDSPVQEQSQSISEYEALSAAEQMFRSGDTQQAVLMCEKLLHVRKHYPFAHDLLGRIYLSVDLPQMAKMHTVQAVGGDSLNSKFKHTHVSVLVALSDWHKADKEVRDLALMAPNWPETWVLYAKVKYGTLDLYSAIASLGIGLELDNNHEGLLALRGRMMLDVGQTEQSEESTNRLLEISPEHTDGNILMANVIARKGDRKAAIERVEKLLEKSPDNLDILSLYANLLREDSQRAESLKQYEAILKQDPYNVFALIGIGIGLAELSQYDQAKQWLDKAELEDPNRPELWAGQAVALSGMGRVNEAVDCSRKAVEMNPDYADGLNNLGLLLVETDDLFNARKHYYRSLEINPHYQEALFNIGLLDLLVGNLDDGWEGYAMRWEASTLKGYKPIYDAEEWDTVTDIKDKTLLLYTEQGFGDCIQFIRYIDLIRHKVGEIIIHCQPELVEMFKTVKGVDQVIEKDLGAPPAEHGKNIPHIDYQQALLTLPQLMKTRLDNVPVNVPYIHTRPDYEVELPEKDDSLFKVAVTWSSNLANIKLLKRNMPFSNLERLFEIEGTRFYNMQLSEPRVEGQEAFDDGRLIDLSPHMENFAHTASLLTQLDLVVSVDTGLVHLCGAMDVPVWVMMPFSADWRWLTGFETNQWYPSLRIMRQQVPHSWPEVLDNVEKDLRETVKEFHAQRQN